jgi:hypothetical protein
MWKKLLHADKLQNIVLKEYFKLWQKRPGNEDYFKAQQVWDGINKKYGKKLDVPLAEGVFNRLLDLKYIEAIKTDDNLIAAHLTTLGFEEIRKMRAQQKTSWTAVVGAITGIIGVVVSIVVAIIKK